MLPRMAVNSYLKQCFSSSIIMVNFLANLISRWFLPCNVAPKECQKHQLGWVFLLLLAFLTLSPLAPAVTVVYLNIIHKSP